MNWTEIGKRIRKQREYLGYTRETLAEKLDVTPKFCSDIELGLKGMSVSTLCRLCSILSLSADYILFGTDQCEAESPAAMLIKSCPPEKRPYLEDMIKAFIRAIDKD